MLSVGPSAAVFAPETVFSVPERKGKTGRSRSRLRPDREPQPIGVLIAAVDPEEWQTVAFRDGPDEGDPVSSR